MTKAYSNKALPPGTVLREWRLEEVLGVGGFGIVYKGRGIYFDELVAIKEYFPSSISERDSDDTVVPIDSDAEEVHALGLKKFVEEAKLLWNLSTPTRHPNIVSVRSLFEIHGTAYIVMDFEDGMSLSKMLKQGRRFNERSLWSILRPIAQGLDRAHRVGVLHRDIKPPNILINEDNSPVLIDFGSARFEAAEATSTTVTFHTPPYAAIEQYVKTYPQGPWTDIYALGVVMYECVTGEKPAEVLERLHAGLGKPLAQGKWPGYTKRFLSGIDAAMLVKPDERPQSIAEWLAMFGKDAEEPLGEEDDEATRFYTGQLEAEKIVPVPSAPNVDPEVPVVTSVPDDPKQVKFKTAGEETHGSRKKGAAAAAAEEKAPSRRRVGKAEPEAEDEDQVAAPLVARAAARDGEAAGEKKKLSPAMMAGGAVALLAVIGAGAFALRGGDPDPATATQSAAPVANDSAATISALGDANAVAAAPVANAVENAAVPEATDQAGDDAERAALRAERAKAAATEAQLAALRKANAKAAAAKAAPSTALAKAKAGAEPKAGPAASTAASKTGEVSPAKLAQFHATVDQARSMAKQAMRSSNRQNAQLARNYDSYLKTLKDSMRGIRSDKEADKLIRQANETKAYIQFLLKQG